MPPPSESEINGGEPSVATSWLGDLGNVTSLLVASVSSSFEWKRRVLTWEINEILFVVSILSSKWQKTQLKLAKTKKKKECIGSWNKKKIQGYIKSEIGLIWHQGTPLTHAVGQKGGAMTDLGYWVFTTFHIFLQEQRPAGCLHSANIKGKWVFWYSFQLLENFKVCFEKLG